MINPTILIGDVFIVLLLVIAYVIFTASSFANDRLKQGIALVLGPVVAWTILRLTILKG